MIIQELHIDGFGKLTNLDLQFEDNVNLIYGDNEAGKSTLCSFIFHMLYGMERGRGKASSFDAYIRYLPWQAAAYGGSLTFESNGFVWLLERSFLTDNRYLRLTRLDDGTVFSDAETQLSQILEGVDSESFRAMYLISQQSCADISSLSEILRQYTQNLPGSGSMCFSPTRALKDLKRQKKELSSQLSGANTGELYQIRDELNDIHNKLQTLSNTRSDTTSDDENPYPQDSLSEDSPDAGTRVPVGARLRLGCLYLFALLFLLFGAALLVCPEVLIPQTTNHTRFPLSALCFTAVFFTLSLARKYKCRMGCRKVEYSLPEQDEFSTDEASELDFNTVFPSEEIRFLMNREETLICQEHELERKLSSDAALRQRITAAQLAIDTISTLSSEIHHTYSTDLQHTFARYASALTGRPFSQILIDENFRFSLMEGSRRVPLEALSRGTITQLFLACRLASIQLLYPDADLPILIDDAFSLTDDTRLSVLLSHLTLDSSGQKLIFSCQKREAAILSQHSLSYHLIQL